MNRRDYLIGVGGLGAISGCLSNESADDTGGGNGDGQTNDTENGNGGDGSTPTNDTQDGGSSEGDDTGAATSPDPNPTTPNIWVTTRWRMSMVRFTTGSFGKDGFFTQFPIISQRRTLQLLGVVTKP